MMDYTLVFVGWDETPVDYQGSWIGKETRRTSGTAALYSWCRDILLCVDIRLFNQSSDEIAMLLKSIFENNLLHIASTRFSSCRQRKPRRTDNSCWMICRIELFVWRRIALRPTGGVVALLPPNFRFLPMAFKLRLEPPLHPVLFFPLFL